MKRGVLAGLCLSAGAASVFGPASAYGQQVEDFYQGVTNDYVTNYQGVGDETVCCVANSTTDLKNYGGLTYMNTLNSASSRYRDLLEFDLSSLTGQGLTLTNATLVLTKASNGTVSSTTDNDELSLNALAATNHGWVQGTSNGSAVSDGSATGDYQSQTATTGAGTNWEDANGDAVPITYTVGSTTYQALQSSSYNGSAIYTNMGYFGGSGSTNSFKDYILDPAGTQFTFTDNTFTNEVANWINNPSTNAGLFMWNYAGSNTTTVSFDTSEFATAADRPTLVLTFAAVPEPASLALLAPGLLLLNRRRRSV